MRKELLVLLLAAVAQAVYGQDCLSVQGLAQATLPAAVLLHDIDGWGGPVYLALENGETLVGVFSGQDGVDAWHGPKGDYGVGVGKGGSYTFAFNAQPGGTYRDTFTTTVTNATFPIPAGKIGLAVYQGSHKIVSGTGRFVNASGTLLVRGSWFVVGPLLDQNIMPFAFWNPDISGTICNVLPAP